MDLFQFEYGAHSVTDPGLLHPKEGKDATESVDHKADSRSISSVEGRHILTGKGGD